MSDNVSRLFPRSCITSSDSFLRASTCFCSRIEVSWRYSFYDSPIQRKRDVIKAGDIPASSNRTRAQTQPEWEEKHLMLSSVRSGWTALVTDCKTSWTLFSVRYLVIPNLFANTAIGSESDWFNLFDWRKMRYAAWTGHIPGWLSSATRVMDWPFCLFFWIQKVTFNFFGNFCRSGFIVWM